MDERKQVTILFADLSGFTSLSEELDPEEITVLLNSFFEEIGEVVRRYDGQINKYIGDEVMVLFGAPVAHEDDPERAVHAALEIMAAVANVEHDIEDEVQWHIGINSGLVVAGEVGASEKREYAVIGDAVNTASRILDEAEGGQILVGESVYERTRHAFEYLEFGAVSMKGKRDKVAVYQPLRALPRQRRLERTMQGGPSAFVGRSQELATLRSALGETSADGVRLVAVQAPAGSGKSRLLYEFQRSLPEQVQFLEGDALPFGEVTAYQPVLDLLRRAWALPSQTREELESEIRDRLEEQDLLDHLSVFEDLFSLDQTDPFYADHSPQRRRTLTIAALLTFFERMTAEGPTVVAIDDIQWADQSTLELLGALIDRFARANILLILLARPEFDWPWSERHEFRLVTLSPLTTGDSGQLVHALLDGEPSQQLVDYIVDRTGGNPFFTEELVRALDEEGALVLDGQYELARPPDTLALPETVQGILSARIDRLELDPKRVLETAAVIGRSFEFEVLARVLDAEPTWLDGHLATLVETQFLEPPPAGSRSHRFVHALTRDVAYGLPLNRVRRGLHADVARAIEDLSPDTTETHPEILAHHYTEAQDVDSAVPLWQRAAQRALQRSANAEAIAHVEKALSLVRTSKGEPDDRLELQLLTSLAVAVLTMKGFTSPEAEEAYAEAREVASRVDDPAMLVPALRGLWIFHNMRGDYEMADELANELLDVAEKAEDLGSVLEARRAAGITSLAQGDLDLAEAHLSTGLELSETGDHSDHIHLYGQDPQVANLVQVGWLLAVKGDLKTSSAYIERSVGRARDIGHPFSIAGALFMSGMVESLRRDWARTSEYASEGIEVAAEHQFGFLLLHCKILAAWSRAQMASEDEEIAGAVEDMQTHLSAYEKSGASWILPYYEAGLASQLGRLGRFGEALETVEQGLGRAEMTGERSWKSELLRVKGGLLMDSGAEPDEVEDVLREAARTARAQGARTFLLAITLDLARLVGQTDDIADQLRELLETIEGEAEHPLLVEAGRILSA